eukprot:jgi/Bigna1/75320/fgenesh1_pg.34_\
MYFDVLRKTGTQFFRSIYADSGPFFTSEFSEFTTTERRLKAVFGLTEKDNLLDFEYSRILMRHAHIDVATANGITSSKSILCDGVGHCGFLRSNEQTLPLFSSSEVPASGMKSLTTSVTKDEVLSGSRRVGGISNGAGKPGGSGLGLVIVEDGEWECPRCDNINYPLSSNCDAPGCKGVRSRSAGGDSKAAFSTDAPKSVPGSSTGLDNDVPENQSVDAAHSLLASIPKATMEWPCERCGFINDTINRFCQNCYLERKSFQQLKSNSQPEGHRLSSHGLNSNLNNHIKMSTNLSSNPQRPTSSQWHSNSMDFQ